MIMAENRPTPQAVLQHLRRELTGTMAAEVDAASIVRYGSIIGSVIESHATLPRAMEHGRRLIVAAAEANRAVASGTVILADTMSRCKGRFARSWHAPFGGVWGCMILANTLLPQSRNFIPLAAGVACCEAIRECGGTDSQIRWVNDVLCGGRKLAGFLVEGYTEPVHGEEFALVGFGINLNNTSFPAELVDTAVSLGQVLGRFVDLTEFTTVFLSRLAWNYGILYFEEARELRGELLSGRQGRHLLLERWLDLTDIIGRRVVYGFDVMTAPQYQAEVLGVDPTGGLILRLADGYVKTEHCGEVRYLK